MRDIPKFFTDSVAELVARRVEWTAEVARQMGFKFPLKYDVGLKILGQESGRDVTVKVRIDDATYYELVALPKLSGDEILDGPKRTEWIETLASISSEAVAVYVKLHPELNKAGTDSALDLLMVGNEVLCDVAAKAARSSEYTQLA